MENQNPPSPSPAHSPPALSPRARLLRGALCGFAACAVFAFAWSIPFQFASSSLLYKTGIFKVLLRGGKLCGISAALLAFFQILLVARLRFLERIVAQKRLYALHRTNGVVLAAFILLHGGGILEADHFALFPLEKRYWPEFLGMGLAALFLLFTGSALLRTRLGLPYQAWAGLHRFSAPGLLALLTVHVLAVSESFHAGPPRWFILALAGAALFLYLRILRRRFSPGRRS